MTSSKWSRGFTITGLIFFLCLWAKALYPSSSGVQDPDFYWHVRYGQWILDHAALPAGDSFSWSVPGKPYQLTQWLGEVVMAIAYQLGGAYGTMLLSLALVATCLGLTWLTARRFVSPAAAMLITIMGNASLIILPMRPQVFSFAATAAVVYLLIDWLERRRISSYAAIVAVMMLWANLHGAFVIGFLILGVVAVGLTVEALLKRPARQGENVIAGIWGLIAACVLASMVHPYGWKVWLAVSQINDLKSSYLVSEWQPLSLTSGTGWFYLMNLIPFLGIIIVAGARVRLPFMLQAGLFFVFGLAANRQVPFVGLVAIPVLAMLLQQTSQYHAIAASIDERPRPIPIGVALLALLTSGFFGSHLAVDRSIATQDLRYPVTAIAFLERHRLTDRVLSDNVAGGYLIHRGIPVFIDGRLDLYGDQLVFEWLLALRGLPGWTDLLAHYQPGALLLPRSTALRQLALASKQWKLVYDDERYSVLLPMDHALPSVAPLPFSYMQPDGTISISAFQ